MDNELLSGLEIIANELERKKLYKEAGQVDSIIKEAQNLVALPGLIINMIKAMNKQKAIMKYTVQDIQQMTDGDELKNIKLNIKKFFQNMAKMTISLLQFCDIPIPPFISAMIANEITNSNVREFSTLINNLPSFITKSKAFKIAGYVIGPLKMLREIKDIADRYVAVDNRMVALNMEDPEEEQQVAMDDTALPKEDDNKVVKIDNKLPKAAPKAASRV